MQGAKSMTTTKYYCMSCHCKIRFFHSYRTICLRKKDELHIKGQCPIPETGVGPVTKTFKYTIVPHNKTLACIE